MTNSDYLFKAIVKKLGEKLNQTLIDSISDATNAAQEVPELIKKELEILKDEIIQEAKRMENLDEDSDNENHEKEGLNLTNKAATKIKEINKQLEMLNSTLDP